MADMGTIDLYETFKKIPDLSDAQARAATNAVAYSSETATKSDITNLKAELKTEFKTDIANLKTELKTDIAEMKAYLTRWMVVMAGVVIAAMSVIVRF